MRERHRVTLVIFVFASVCLGFTEAIQAGAGAGSTNLETNSWPMYQNDPGHSGYSLSPGPLGNQTIWKSTTDDAFWSAPTIVNGVLYAASDSGSVYALNVSTGTLLWRYRTTGAISSSPAVADGMLYVGYMGGFCTLNASSGMLLWNFATPTLETYSSPVAFNGVVYVGGNANVYALNALTGDKIWGFFTNSTMVFAPAIDNNLVIVCASYSNWAISSSVYALDASTGSLVWNCTVKSQFHTSLCTSPTIADGKVFVGFDNGYQYALDEATGQILWSNGTKIWINDGYGYVANGHVAPAAIANGRVYFGATSDNNLSLCNIYALDEFTGQKIWTYHMDCWVNGPVALAGDEVFFTGNDRYIYALNAGTGCEVWKYMTGSGTMSSPSVAGGIVYVGSDDGSVYAIGGGSLSYAPNPTAKPTAAPTPTSLLTPTVSPLPTRVFPPSSNSTPTPSPSPTPTFGFEMAGNITNSQVSEVYWVTNQTATRISFTVTGESGTFGLGNLTIAKSRIPPSTTPVIYVDGVVVPDQGYTQDAYNYYIWYIVHFSTHQIKIEFNYNAVVSPQPTNPIIGSQGEINYQSVIYVLAVAFAIVTAVIVVLKLALKEKKKP